MSLMAELMKEQALVARMAPEERRAYNKQKVEEQDIRMVHEDAVWKAEHDILKQLVATLQDTPYKDKVYIEAASTLAKKLAKLNVDELEE